jgi:hypothetical protein
VWRRCRSDPTWLGLGPNDVSLTIRDRSKNLDGLLGNRPTRDRLQSLNVIREDDNVAPSLIAYRDKLPKAQNKVCFHLSSFVSR